MEKPVELQVAEMIEMICQRYHCLPSEARREPVSVLRHLEILAAEL